LYLLGIPAAYAVSQHGEIIADEERGIARRRPERVPDLVALVQQMSKSMNLPMLPAWSTWK